MQALKLKPKPPSVKARGPDEYLRHWAEIFPDQFPGLYMQKRHATNIRVRMRGAKLDVQKQAHIEARPIYVLLVKGERYTYKFRLLQLEELADVAPL